MQLALDLMENEHNVYTAYNTYTLEIDVHCYSIEEARKAAELVKTYGKHVRQRRKPYRCNYGTTLPIILSYSL